MTRTIKWAVLCVAFAIVSILLYTTIDSEWAADNNLGILMTIAFFATATVTILCGFNAVESKDQTLQH